MKELNSLVGVDQTTDGQLLCEGVGFCSYFYVRLHRSS